MRISGWRELLDSVGCDSGDRGEGGLTIDDFGLREKMAALGIGFGFLSLWVKCGGHPAPPRGFAGTSRRCWGMGSRRFPSHRGRSGPIEKTVRTLVSSDESEYADSDCHLASGFIAEVAGFYGGG